MPVEISTADSTRIETLKEQIVDVYRKVFSAAPFLEGEERVRGFAQTLSRHADYPAFRCQVAKEKDELLGFAYGHTNEPGQ